MDIYQLFSLGGGVALFLYGMSMMGDGLKKVAGDRMREWLNMLTSRRIFGVLVGMGVTAVIQSSAAVTVMVVGFVNASLMTLQQAIGVIMGSSIGTTMTGILVSFKLTAIAPLLVLLGAITQMFIRNKKIQRVGYIVLGFGMLFMGMSIMSTSLEPLADSELFHNVLASMRNPVVGLLVGAAVTCLIQSSSAFSGILITMSLEGLMTLEIAIPMLIGSNIGTCITALLASIGTSRNARIAAVMHLIYKICGAAVSMLLLQFIPFVEILQGASPAVNWQIAGFNTFYNIFNCVILFPFANWFVKVSEKLVPKGDEGEEEMCLQYIADISKDASQLYVPQLMMEAERMKTMSVKNFKLAMRAFVLQSTEKMEKLLRREEIIDYLNHEITSTLVQANSLNLSEGDCIIVSEMYHVLHDLERIGDHSMNIMEYVDTCQERHIVFSEEAMKELEDMGEKVGRVIEICWKAYKERDISYANEAETMEARVDDMTRELKDHHIERLKHGNCSAKSSMVYTDMVTDLERISDHAIGILHVMQGSFRQDRVHAAYRPIQPPVEIPTLEKAKNPR